MHKTIETFVKDSGGVVGPHTFFALPGSMMITGLSNDSDHSGRTALVEYNDDGEWQAKSVADIGNPADIPLPADICIAADDQTLWVNSFMDGRTRLFDMSDPHNLSQICEKVIDRQVNMVSQSWDGKRVYYSSSLLAHWDKKGADDAQYLRTYNWDGNELMEDFNLDFYELKLGRAHIMRFGSSELYA